ncbi:MAG: hypothetical protein DRJ52_02440 [Thermoprotei archaeon]|nr:MAG: hypothetical protein DRJ52_02440 [Thermoprotei archaeon]
MIEKELKRLVEKYVYYIKAKSSKTVLSPEELKTLAELEDELSREDIKVVLEEEFVEELSPTRSSYLKDIIEGKRKIISFESEWGRIYLIVGSDSALFRQIHETKEDLRAAFWLYFYHMKNLFRNALRELTRGDLSRASSMVIAIKQLLPSFLREDADEVLSYLRNRELDYALEKLKELRNKVKKTLISSWRSRVG